MFLFVTATAILLALMSIPTGMGRLALPLIVAVVVLHILSTMLGSRLRALADDRRQWNENHGIIDGEVMPARTQQTAARAPMPQSPLSARSTIPGWSWQRILAGAAAGGVFGGIVLAATIGHRTSWLGIAMGAISTAILGAWLVFLGHNFWCIARYTWRETQAHHQQQDDEARRRSGCRGDSDGS